MKNSTRAEMMVYPRVMLRSGETYYFPESAKVIRFQEPRPIPHDEISVGGVYIPINMPMYGPYQDACALLYFGGDTTISIDDPASCKALREWCEWRAVTEGRVIV
jgi:hypothetical protein